MRPLPTGSDCHLTLLPHSTASSVAVQAVALANDADVPTGMMGHLRAEGGAAGLQGMLSMEGSEGTGLPATAVSTPSTSLLEGGVSLLVLLVVCGIISLVRLKALWYPLVRRTWWRREGGGVAESIRQPSPPTRHGRPGAVVGEYGSLEEDGEDAAL